MAGRRPDRARHRRQLEQWFSDERSVRRQQQRLRQMKRRNAGLRGRLTRVFALLALFAVVLTSLLTVGAAYRTLNKIAPELGLGSVPRSSFGQPDFGPSDSASDVPSPAEEANLQRWRELGHAAGGELQHSAFTAGLLSFLAAVVLAAIVTRQITRPLSRLADAARRLEAGERDVQLPVPPRHDEVRDLTLTFNSLTTSLSRQEAWRRSLMADIAHDLRTPLSVLRSEIEAMQDGVNRTDDAGLARLHGEVLLLARLVTDLRTLSLAESGAMDLHPGTLDAAGLLRAVLTSFTRQAGEVGLQLRLDAPQLVSVHADPDRLTQVLHNLIGNALRYAAPGEVVLSARAEGQWAVLQVRDYGPGFQPDDLSRAFERFFRADVSRTRDPTGLRSSGLGLAIARALTEAQGGQIEARNHPLGGAEFTLRLPRAESGL